MGRVVSSAFRSNTTVLGSRSDTIPCTINTAVVIVDIYKQKTESVTRNPPFMGTGLLLWATTVHSIERNLLTARKKLSLAG